LTMPKLPFASRPTTIIFRFLRNRKGHIMINALLLRFFRSRDANIAVIFALAMVPTIYLLGMALD
jgi:hypothetical protein